MWNNHWQSLIGIFPSQKKKSVVDTSRMERSKYAQSVFHDSSLSPGMGTWWYYRTDNCIAVSHGTMEQINGTDKCIAVKLS